MTVVPQEGYPEEIADGHFVDRPAGMIEPACRSGPVKSERSGVETIPQPGAAPFLKCADTPREGIG